MDYVNSVLSICIKQCTKIINNARSLFLTVLTKEETINK